MPLPKNRSTSVRKVHVRTPKGGNAIHYIRREKGGRHSCGICGTLLQAVSSKQKLSSSERTPNRKFGGNLCTGCTSRLLVVSSRVSEGALKMEEVDITLLPYVKRLVPKKE